MTLQVDILDALMARLSTPDLTDPATPIAWPMVPFQPDPDAAYLDARPVMRADVDKPWIGFDSTQIHRGIFQVDAVVPQHKGEAVGLALAELVAARFPTGTIIQAGAYQVKILDAVSIATAIIDAPWARYPVSIPYFVAAG